MISEKNNVPFFVKKAEPTGKTGQKIIAFPENYTVIDLETTGLCAGRDLIIEFAAVKVRGLEVVEEFQSLCDPGFPIPPQIESITGITTEMVRFSPNPRSVLPDFLNFIGDDFIIGHNVNFDVRFIAASAEFFRNDYIDTMAIFRKLHPSLPHHRLSDMVDFYGKRNETAHRALSDCFATQACFEAMRDEINCIFGKTCNFLTKLK